MYTEVYQEQMFLMGVAGQISALFSIKGMRDQFFFGGNYSEVCFVNRS